MCSLQYVHMASNVPMSMAGVGVLPLLSMTLEIEGFEGAQGPLVQRVMKKHLMMAELQPYTTAVIFLVPIISLSYLHYSPEFLLV